MPRNDSGGYGLEVYALLCPFIHITAYVYSQPVSSIK